MQRKIIIALACAGLAMISAFRYNRRTGPADLKVISRQEVFKNKSYFSCSPDWRQLNIDSLASGISILPGWGNYQWKIASKNDSARLYFQQGINMYYSFHIIEAMASFKKAGQFDNSNAMIYWARALSYGPNINDFAYSYTPDAYAAAQKAISLAAACTPREKSLIKAMGVRYTSDSTISRAVLNQLYTDEMHKGYLQFPDDADMASLYADAMMLQHPWDLWKHDGTPKPWTPEILKVLEQTLKQSPLHPAANHYYIHSVEASGNPQRALASADRLSKLMPAVSHMVHMPSHIYIRAGLYTKGMVVNEMSLAGYKAYISLYPGVENNAALYQIHNLHMQSACAMMGAGYDYSLKAATACRESFDTAFMSIPGPIGNFMQYIYMTPVFNNIRFGKWEEVLNAAAISPGYVYANVLSHWAKGIAFARKNNTVAAKKELAIVKENMNRVEMLVVSEPFNSPISAAQVAEKLLEGIIAEQENDLATAASLFEESIKYEADMIYNEPKDWILPVRPWLGNVLLKKGSFAEAAGIFRDDLKENPHNHWSLKGLYEALKKQHKNAEANHVKIELDKASATAGMGDLPIVF